MRAPDSQTILAIEAAVNGGSLAVMRDGEVLGEFCGESPTTRSELLLDQIDRFLNKTVGSLRAIDHIVASNGPGSYTGIRIGIATSIGLSQARGIGLSGADLLRSMVVSAGVKGTSGVMIPMGKSDICFQIFHEGSVEASPQTYTVPMLIDLLEKEAIPTIVAPTFLIQDQFAAFLRLSSGIVDAGECLARHIAKAVTIGGMGEDVRPIYVPNPRFAS